MSQQRYWPEFKDEAVRQVTERGHSVQEVAARLGVSSHSLYKWVKAVRPSKDEQRTDELLDAKKEILKLRAEIRPRAANRSSQALCAASRSRCRTAGRRRPPRASRRNSSDRRSAGRAQGPRVQWAARP